MDKLDTLKKRPRMVFEYIQNYCKEYGYPPSVRDIGKAVGLKSSSTVHMYLVQLEEQGFIRRDPARPRAIVINDNEDIPNLEMSIRQIPVVGKVAAGSPIMAQENIENYMAVPVDLLGQGNYYILKVKGDSMIEAGIFDNDYVIVHEQRDASNGEIVVALLEDEATVKRYYKMPDHIRLQPENSTMEPIVAKEISILGKVAGLMRRM